jgi:tetratricopeptide (TPR) repeat protein
LAHLSEKKDRHVLPNWRSFENTVRLGELNGSKGIILVSDFKPDIDDLLNDWNEMPSIGMAADVLGAAIVANQQLHPDVITVAEFILNNRKSSSRSLINAAKEVLTPRSKEIETELDINSVESFREHTNLTILHQKISQLKKRLISDQGNAVNWMELARLYAILGQVDKATRSIKNALFLASENRFILRNAARFLVHVGGEGLEHAHDIIRRSELVKHDPWLMATEISLATLRDRSSRFTKNGLQILESGNFHPFNVTELASAIATVELKNANVKKSRKLFEQSLCKPNDNSLAQAEWASEKGGISIPGSANHAQIPNSFEAAAREFAQKKQWKNAVEYSKKWFLDLPFSKGSILFGNDIAIKKMKDHKLAVEVAKLGLVSHPHDPHLLNNIMFSLCIQNKVSEAAKVFTTVRKEDMQAKTMHSVCLLATQGLLKFREGNAEAGRKLYIDSIKLAGEIGQQGLASSALVNFTREEILFGQVNVTDLIPRLKDMERKTDDVDLKGDISSVLDLYSKRNK